MPNKFPAHAKALLGSIVDRAITEIQGPETP